MVTGFSTAFASTSSLQCSFRVLLSTAVPLTLTVIRWVTPRSRNARRYLARLHDAPSVSCFALLAPLLESVIRWVAAFRACVDRAHNLCYLQTLYHIRHTHKTVLLAGQIIAGILFALCNDHANQS
jgi:hypothetical protein